MRRLFLLLITLSFLPVCSRADVGVEFRLAGEMYLVKEPYGRPFSYKLLPVFGGAIYFQAGRFVTLNYTAGYTKYNVNKHCIRSSLALIVAGGLNYYGNGPLSFVLGVIPKGIGFYTRADHSGFHISFNVLPCDYFYEGKIGNREAWYFAFGPAVRYRIPAAGNRFNIVPYAEIVTGGHALSFIAGCQLTFERIHHRKHDKQIRP